MLPEVYACFNNAEEFIEEQLEEICPRKKIYSEEVI